MNHPVHEPLPRERLRDHERVVAERGVQLGQYAASGRIADRAGLGVGLSFGQMR